MAKDRRNDKTPRKEVSKGTFMMRIALVAGAVLIAVGVFLLIGGVAGCATVNTFWPTDATPSAVTTTTVNRTDETTVAPAVTTTTMAVTTTTAAPTTTTATTSPYPADGTWNMILVNPWNPLTEAQVGDQSNLAYHSNGESVDYRVVDALNDMLADGSQYGLYVTSGYRSYDLQSRLYENKVQRVINAEGCSREEALEIAATVVARPGTSEHHTGLAVDLLHNECWELEEYWDQSDAFDWMMAHCHEYGFILRYPKEKQEITGVIYEPWHYRYVGVEAATEIMSRGITLEEYLAEKGLQ